MNSIAPRKEQIFGRPEEVLQETKKLRRLIELDQALQKLSFPHNRRTTLEKVSVIWEENLNNPIRFIENFKKEILNRHESELTIRGKKSSFPQFIQQKIAPATSDYEIQKIGKKILQDCSSATKTPIKRAASGLKGPTLLVDFPTSNLKDEFSITAYVLKWVKKEEVAGTLLYRMFANWFGQVSSIGFSVPKNSGFDFRNHLHKTCEEKICLLSHPVSQKLQHSFSSILTSLDPTSSDPKLQPKGDQLLIMERIQGENLFDFARVKYKLLSSKEKKEFFVKLGKLVPFDLLFGHLDRLVKLSITKDEYSLAPIASNVGNVMISRDDTNQNLITQKNDKLEIYAIDNGLKLKLIEDHTKKTNYLNFITQLFRKERAATEIAEVLIDSLESGFKSTADDQPNVAIALNELKEILEDLRREDGSPGIALSYLEEGIREMFDILRDNILSDWQSVKANSLKGTLKIFHPTLLNAVDERIEKIYNT